MLNMRYLKFQPSQYILRYKKGRLAGEGAGLSFFCYLPGTAVAALPVGSIDAPFIFEETTEDFQKVSVQGQLVYRIADQHQAAGMLDFTLNLKNLHYNSEDPKKLSERLVNCVKVEARKQLETRKLEKAVQSGELLADAILTALKERVELTALGVEVLGLSVLAVMPVKETARALEAQTREEILKTADDAMYQRRNASIAQERGVKENEYNTEITIETKKRQVQETQLEAKQAVQLRENKLREEQLLYEITLEEKRRTLVELKAKNEQAEADTRAYALTALMQAFKGVEPAVLQSLASVGMQPQQMMAMAFQGLAGNAEKIGQLNITPDLLQEMMQRREAI